MNLRENIRRILKEGVNSVDVKTIESELTNMLGSSKIKDGDRVEFVRIGQFNSSFDIVVDQLDQKTLNIINKFMSEKGWFPTNISLSGMKGRIYSDHVNDYIGEEDVQIGYEADFAKEVGIPKTKAFHVTPDIFMDKIKVTGLTAKSESKLSNHPERIYMFLSQDKNAPKDMVQTIWNSLSKERQKEIKDYYVLEIDLTKLPNQKLYHDPQTMITFEAIYTNQPIPKSAIKVIDKISTSNIKTNDNVVMTKDEEKSARKEQRRKEEERLQRNKEFDFELSQTNQRIKDLEKLPDDIKNMNIDDLLNLEESIKRILREDKKLKLLSNIKENGLYDVISSTGLHINQVEQKVGQLSREVLERFITDVLKEHGEFLAEETQTYTIDLDGWPLDAVPIANDEYVERIRTTDDELLFTVVFYEENEFRDLEEASYEIMQSKKFKYDNIYEIAGQLAFYLAKGKL
jgi:hypothetical protein